MSLRLDEIALLDYNVKVLVPKFRKLSYNYYLTSQEHQTTSIVIMYKILPQEFLAMFRITLLLTSRENALWLDVATQVIYFLYSHLGGGYDNLARQPHELNVDPGAFSRGLLFLFYYQANGQS